MRHRATASVDAVARQTRQRAAPLGARARDRTLRAAVASPRGTGGSSARRRRGGYARRRSASRRASPTDRVRRVRTVGRVRRRAPTRERGGEEERRQDQVLPRVRRVPAVVERGAGDEAKTRLGSQVRVAVGAQDPSRRFRPVGGVLRRVRDAPRAARVRRPQGHAPRVGFGVQRVGALVRRPKGAQKGRDARRREARRSPKERRVRGVGGRERGARARGRAVAGGRRTGRERRRVGVSSGARARARARRADAPVRRRWTASAVRAFRDWVAFWLRRSRVVRREQPLQRNERRRRRLRGVENRCESLALMRRAFDPGARLPRGSPRSRVRRLASLLLGVRSASAPTRRRTKRAPERIGPRHLGRLGERAEGGEFRAERVDAPALARARRVARVDRETRARSRDGAQVRPSHVGEEKTRGVRHVARGGGDRRRRSPARGAHRREDRASMARQNPRRRVRRVAVARVRRRPRHLLRRAALRLSRRFVASAFDAWRGDVADIRGFKVLRERYARILDSMLRRRLHAAFYRWDDAVYERRRARVAVARALGRLRNRTAGAAFGAWRRRARDRVAHRAKLRRGDHAVQKALAKMRRVVRRRVLRVVGRVAERGRRAAAERGGAVLRRRAALPRRAAFRWRFAAFERLREKRVAVAVVRRAAADDGCASVPHVAGRRAAPRRLESARRTEASARRILRRVVTRELRAGFAGWSFAVAERSAPAALRGAAAKWAGVRSPRVRRGRTRSRRARPSTRLRQARSDRRSARGASSVARLTGGASGSEKALEAASGEARGADPAVRGGARVRDVVRARRGREGSREGGGERGALLPLPREQDASRRV